MLNANYRNESYPNYYYDANMKLLNTKHILLIIIKVINTMSSYNNKKANKNEKKC